MKPSRKAACSMPAIGERAPERMLVAVRAIAPVAGRPPKQAEAVLAMPCATSSQLERWRAPVMPSATLADSRLSIPARKAMVKADGSTSTACCRLKAGSDGRAGLEGGGKGVGAGTVG